jgi:predicted metal-dependent peptidase
MSENFNRALKIINTLLPVEAILLSKIGISHTVPEGYIAAANGKKIYISLNAPELKATGDFLFVILHELAHIVMGHCKHTSLVEDFKLYNVAADNVINAFIRKEEVWCNSAVSRLLSETNIETQDALNFNTSKIVKGKLNVLSADDGNKLSVMETYKQLLQNKKSNTLRGLDDLQPDENGGIDTELKEAIAEYALGKLSELSDKGRGDEPLGRDLEVIADSFKKVKEPWVSIITRYFKKNIKNIEWSPRKWDRKSLQRDQYRKGFQVKEALDICIAVDTSGSMTGEMLTYVERSVNIILRNINYKTAKVLYCDCDTPYEQNFRKGVPVKLEFKGGGGTDVRPVFDYIADKGYDNKIGGLLYFSDMDFLYPDKIVTDYPVIWGALGCDKGAVSVPSSHKVVYVDKI